MNVHFFSLPMQKCCLSTGNLRSRQGWWKTIYSCHTNKLKLDLKLVCSFKSRSFAGQETFIPHESDHWFSYLCIVTTLHQGREREVNNWLVWTIHPVSLYKLWRDFHKANTGYPRYLVWRATTANNLTYWRRRRKNKKAQPASDRLPVCARAYFIWFLHWHR